MKRSLGLKKHRTKQKPHQKQSVAALQFSTSSQKEICCPGACGSMCIQHCTPSSPMGYTIHDALHAKEISNFTSANSSHSGTTARSNKFGADPRSIFYRHLQIRKTSWQQKLQKGLSSKA